MAEQPKALSGEMTLTCISREPKDPILQAVTQDQAREVLKKISGLHERIHKLEMERLDPWIRCESGNMPEIGRDVWALNIKSEHAMVAKWDGGIWICRDKNWEFLPSEVSHYCSLPNPPQEG